MGNLEIIAAVLAFGVIILVAIFITMWNKEQGFGPNNLRAVGIVTIITLATVIFIMDASKSDAVIGLLGVIAGYLFGIKIEDK